MDRRLRRFLPDRFEKPSGPAREPERIAGYIADQNTLLAVAEQAGQVVGVVNARLEAMPGIPIKKQFRFLKIRGVIVDESSRRKGIGSALVRYAERWAFQRGAAEVQLNVYRFDRVAQAFCRSLGFEPLSQRLVRRLSPRSRD
jgi:ribosomal protein S18 acetylase RimI-like enzyme